MPLPRSTRRCPRMWFPSSRRHCARPARDMCWKPGRAHVTATASLCGPTTTRTPRKRPSPCSSICGGAISADREGPHAMRTGVRAACLAACTAILVAPPAAAWDFPGHRIVGAIADLVLQHYDPATQRRVSDLMELRVAGGEPRKRSLREVAVFADCAKRGNEPYCGRPPSDEEKDYAARNPHHGSYHFTDVPLQQMTYAPGSAGTADTDVVHMIEYAVAQLRGKSPPGRKDVDLTDTEAVWLIAHLVGD